MEMKHITNILHVTTHMGGGVGKVISDLITSDLENRHKLLVLQKPEKMQFISKCREHGIQIGIEPSKQEITEEIRQADVIVLHWWHHPLMSKFLYEFPECEVRTVLWSHVSGCTYPYLSYNFLNKFDRVFFTSECSLNNEYWEPAEKDTIVQKSTVIYGLGKLEHMKKKEVYETGTEVKVGYVGTLAQSKIHPDFVNICNNILQRRKDIKFILVGDKNVGEWIEKESGELGIENHIELRGYCQNVNECLLEFDVFGYPLNPYHFGTTENSILEAMSVGLPVVLLDQMTEHYIVTDGVDGLLSDGIEQYGENILKLIEDKTLREKLGGKAAEDIGKKFDFERNKENFTNAMNEVMQLDKRKINLREVLGNTPYEWFLSGVNKKDREYFAGMKATSETEKRREMAKRCQHIFREKSKSSVIHFSSVYPENEELKNLKQLLN